MSANGITTPPNFRNAQALTACPSRRRATSHRIVAREPDLLPKVKRMQTEGEAVFIDPNGYVDSIKEAKADFDETVATQTPKSSQAKPLQ
jgi:hypothetical protein